MSLPEIDTFLFFLINKSLENIFFDIIMPFITQRAYLIFLPIYLWLVFHDRKKSLIALLLAFASLLISDWSAYELKHYFERMRPCIELNGVRVLIGCRESFSMPSNHAVNAFAFVTPFFILFRNRIRYVLIVLACLVGFSRVYVGVHYPSDVFAGAILGIGLALSVFKVYRWSSARYKVKPYTTVLFIFLLSLSLFRIYYILHGPLDLGPDEAHYWEWSRRLDLSYYSKGPMIAYLIYLGTSLFGKTVFGIRFLAVFFSALSSIFLYMLGKRLYHEQVGLASAILLQIIPLFSTFGVLFTIDSPFIFFWILSLFLFSKAANIKTINPFTPPMKKSAEEGFGKDEERSAYDLSFVCWLLLGLSIGLGLLTKYTMAFFYPCAFLFLVLSKEKRIHLFTKGPYVALVVSFIVFSPVIIWNANHDWVTIRHTAGQMHIAEGIQISPGNIIEFIGSQLGVITPLLFILMAASIWKLWKNKESHFLFWFSIPILGFFLFKSIQAKVQANWALPGYITGIIAFSAFYLKRFHFDGNGKKILTATAILLSLIITLVAHYPSIVNLPVKLDPTARLRGWAGLGEEVTAVYKQMSLNRPVFIFSDRYQVSSQLAFYVQGNPVTYCINLNRRMNQYDLWPGFNHLLHYDAIFVKTGDTTVPEKVLNAFEKVEKKVFTAYTKKHMKLRDYSIFMCYDFKGLREDKPGTY